MIRSHPKLAPNLFIVSSLPTEEVNLFRGGFIAALFDIRVTTFQRPICSCQSAIGFSPLFGLRRFPDA
jgi:hypothetical protein